MELLRCSALAGASEIVKAAGKTAMTAYLPGLLKCCTDILAGEALAQQVGHAQRWRTCIPLIVETKPNAAFVLLKANNGAWQQSAVLPKRWDGTQWHLLEHSGCSLISWPFFRCKIHRCSCIAVIWDSEQTQYGDIVLGVVIIPYNHESASWEISLIGWFVGAGWKRQRRRGRRPGWRGRQRE